jgi:hypothetical protein
MLQTNKLEYLPRHFFKADLMFLGMAKSSSHNRNIRLARKDSLDTNTLAYFSQRHTEKKFYIVDTKSFGFLHFCGKFHKHFVASKLQFFANLTLLTKTQVLRGQYYMTFYGRNYLPTVLSQSVSQSVTPIKV